MHVLIGIALKSLLIAGLTLGLLAMMKKRSAAERSWVAHIGLLALVIMAFAPLVLPSWNVETPALFGQTAGEDTAIQPSIKAPETSSTAPSARVTPSPAPAEVAINSTAVATAAYAVPAAILLFITLLALGRLIALRARADVLVDGHWLSALARAQRRMGFKHGTALLTSNELASPISWGLMRPVILLNDRAVEASAEAEAIIAHELAHVARMDWAKLLLARIATALFWFNPLVWVLAREAHQLREETADDAVLAADIDDTDYAQLLVGVARHECPGLLLGAHGVAPSKSSLARRVARVLDGTSVRGPVARSFAMGVFVGAVLVAAPLAALTLTPEGSSGRKSEQRNVGTSSKIDTTKPYYAGMDVPTDLASIIAEGVTTSVSTAVASVSPMSGESRIDPADAAAIRSEVHAAAAEHARELAEEARDIARDARADARTARRDSAIDRAIGARAVGVTPEYVGAMRAAAPKLSNADLDDLTGMRAVGVTPEFARDLASAGFPSITADELTEARAVGLTGGYVRAMRAAGIQGSLDDFVQLRAVGVDPSLAARARRAGMKNLSADDLVELHAVGAVRPLSRPKSPRPPSPPSDWDPPDPDG
jgi:bla regulator protein BlaR1